MKLKGRYIKALKNFKYGFTKNNYYELLENSLVPLYHHVYTVRDNKGNKSAVDMDRIKHGDIELMPEDFNPNNIIKEPIIKIW